MDKYLIVVDLDGTLLEGWTNPNIDSIDYLKSIKDKHDVIIATGRPYRLAKAFYKYLELDTPIITYNGALVTNPSDDSFKRRSKGMDIIEVEKILTSVEPLIKASYFEINEINYVFKRDDILKEFMQPLNEDSVIDVENFPKENAHSAILFAKEGHHLDVIKYIEENSNLSCRSWGEKFKNIIELFDNSIEKGTALSYLIDFMQIDGEKVIAFGDELNDISMLNVAKYGIAMGNASPDRLLSHASYKTLKNTEGGIKVFLEAFFKGDISRFEYK